MTPIGKGLLRQDQIKQLVKPLFVFYIVNALWLLRSRNFLSSSSRSTSLDLLWVLLAPTSPPLGPGKHNPIRGPHEQSASQCEEKLLQLKLKLDQTKLN